MSYSTTKSKKG